MDDSQPLSLAILGSRGFPSTYGGYETLVRYLARDWTQRGHRVTVYCRTREGARRAWLDEDVRCVWTPGLDSKSWSTLTFGLTSHIDALWRAFDAVLVLNVANGFFLPLLRWCGVPTAVNTDGIEWERGKWGPNARRAFRTGARLCATHADVLVADSRAISLVWRSLFGVESTYVPYGAPVIDEPGSGLVEGLGVTPGRYVLVVARLIPENNVDMVLDAVDGLSVRPETVVVGSANFDSPLEARLREADGSGRVRWLGHVSDQVLLTQLWANAGVYVHGHSVGGTNPGLLQALGAGAPTLALDTPYNREVLRTEEQLFPARATALAAAIETVLADADMRAEWSGRGKEVVRAHYDWDDVSTRYLEALMEARERMRLRTQVRGKQ